MDTEKAALSLTDAIQIAIDAELNKEISILGPRQDPRRASWSVRKLCVKVLLCRSAQNH